jgi:hypothetical protein
MLVFAAYQFNLVSGIFERLKMLICKVCERAAESIIDELAIFALTEKYPEHLALLIDGLIDLTDFEWEQNQIELGNAGRDDHISGGSFIYKLLSSTYLKALQESNAHGKLHQTYHSYVLS